MNIIQKNINLRWDWTSLAARKDLTLELFEENLSYFNKEKLLEIYNDSNIADWYGHEISISFYNNFFGNYMEKDKKQWLMIKNEYLYEAFSKQKKSNSHIS